MRSKRYCEVLDGYNSFLYFHFNFLMVALEATSLIGWDLGEGRRMEGEVFTLRDVFVDGPSSFALFRRKFIIYIYLFIY